MSAQGGPTVTGENTAMGTYQSEQGTLNLGILKNTNGFWIDGVEIVGSVTPSNFGQPITLVRTVAFRVWTNSTLFNTSSPDGQDDTSTSTHRDDSITSSGKIYDTDTPLLGAFSSQIDGTVIHFRLNAVQWAVIGYSAGADPTTLPKVSANLSWFTRFSIDKFSILGNVLDTNIQGDNQTGTGTTALSPNLQ
jgi:hypothetical protein